MIKPSEFKISKSVESYDEKNAKNYQNYYVADKRSVLKLSKITIQIEDLNKDGVKFSSSYHIYFPRNKPSKNVTVGLGVVCLGWPGPSIQLSMIQLLLKWS